MLPHSPADTPLVVDLDGTLIHSDLLWEAIVQFIKARPLQAWRLLAWLMLGKAGFKRELAARVVVDPAALPYNAAVLQRIREERTNGRTIVLATGSERRFAEQVAGHLKLFDAVHATDGALNLTSHDKARHLAGLYGDKGFDYVGNCSADLPTWQRSRTAISVARRAFRLGDGRSTEALGTPLGYPAAALLRAMRPRQWLKNLLVFVPMLAAHRLDAASFALSLAAFAAFSLCASSAYLLNDALDATDDRGHPSKRHRPVATGALPLPLALFASPALALAGLALGAAYSPMLLLALLVYFATTLGYSMYLKRLLMVDIVTLALLYSMRILGGGAATGIVPSFWLLAFSFFIFLSLALLKRHSELVNLAREGKEKAGGRGYLTGDRIPVGIMGVNSAFVSVLVLMLYFGSANVLVMYRHPQWLAGILPLLVCWLGRLWTLSYRGQVNEDPVLYVSRDPASLCVIGLCAALATAAAI